MLLLALALAVQTTSEADVVVVARRLQNLRIVLRKDRRTGIQKCVFKRRSGDPALDQGVCDAMLACAPTVKTERDIRICMEPAIKALLPKAQWEGKRP